jgi:hypothetical protein
MSAVCLEKLDFALRPSLAFGPVDEATDGPRKGFNPPLEH